MKLLALESSGLRCSVGLMVDGALLFRAADADTRNSEVLLPMVRAVLHDAGISVKGLDAIAFGAGPGAFTGLRVACGVAQGLAFGADLPVVPVGTLEILAETWSAAAGYALPACGVLAGLDARMGECYWGEVRHVDGDWIVGMGPVLCKPDAVPLPEGGDWAGVGDAFALFGSQLQARLGTHYPHSVLGTAQAEAGALARLAALRFSKGQAIAPEHAQPLYVRDKVALTRQERGVGP